MTRRSLVLAVCVALVLHQSSGQCLVENISRQVGEQWRDDDKCVGHTCLEDGSYNTTVCPAEVIPAGYLQAYQEDDSVPSPDCCPRYVPPPPCCKPGK